jgi:hypothetical protein
MTDLVKRRPYTLGYIGIFAGLIGVISAVLHY